MKITIEHYKEKFTFETETDDLTISDVHEIWIKCLIAMSFGMDLINDFYKDNQ